MVSFSRLRPARASDRVLASARAALVLAGALAMALGAPRASGAERAAGAENFRGGKVEWARLRTDGPYWKRHGDYDNELLHFIRRETTLNIDEVWYAAGARDLAELCTYPFLFSDNIAKLTTATERRHLAEYLRRGGFLLIDACANKEINPNLNVFLARQVAILRAEFPDLQLGEFEPGHEIFSIYFKMRDRPPQTHTGNKESGIAYPLYALSAGDRLIGVISLSSFQCAWAGYGDPGSSTAAMQMVTNIYIYAITR